jgi:hypothetical protein
MKTNFRGLTEKEVVQFRVSEMLPAECSLQILKQVLYVLNSH